MAQSPLNKLVVKSAEAVNKLVNNTILNAIKNQTNHEESQKINDKFETI